MTSAAPLMHKRRRYLVPLLLLYVSVCLPLGLMVYTPYAYQWYCPINPRCELLGLSLAQQSMQQLAEFFRHQIVALSYPWSVKEQRHMLEVRAMYDMAALGVLLALLWMGYDLRQPEARQRYRQYVRHSLWLSVGLLLAGLAVMPFFQYFWLHIFHPLLFDNELWRTDRADISWYLMPRQFFMWAIGGIVISSLLLHLLLYAALKPKPLP